MIGIRYPSTNIHLQLENVVMKGSTLGYILRKTSYGIAKRSIRILPIFSSARSKLGSLFEAVGRVTKGKFANQRPMKMSSINSLERFAIPYEVFLRIYGKIPLQIIISPAVVLI